MRFKFAEKNILRKGYPCKTDGSLLDLGDLQDKNNTALYTSEEGLINELLKNKEVKHFRQIRFLASKHARNVMKLQLVLQPFSFVFLILGKKAIILSRNFTY